MERTFFFFYRLFQLILFFKCNLEGVKAVFHLGQCNSMELPDFCWEKWATLSVTGMIYSIILNPSAMYFHFNVKQLTIN